MIEIQNLHFAYGTGDFELNIEELSVPDGERCCWIGASGSGKTTLLHLVAGIISAEVGRVTSCGTDWATLSEPDRREFRLENIGLVFQDFALLDYLNVLENILLPYRMSHHLKLGASDREHAKEVATGVGLGSLLARKPVHLSQGERQRVAICRAIVAKPKLILADEPTANLDAANTERVLEALDNYAIQHQSTLIVVSHDQDVIGRYEQTLDVSQFVGSAEKSVVGSDKSA